MARFIDYVLVITLQIRHCQNQIRPLGSKQASTLDSIEASKDCRGSFSRDFSNGFDRYRCDLVVRKIGSDFKIQVPLPQ
jgi:hypothetical protein